MNIDKIVYIGSHSDLILNHKRFLCCLVTLKKADPGALIVATFLRCLNRLNRLTCSKRETAGSVSGYCVIWAPQQSIGQLYWWILGQHMGGHIGLHLTCQVDYKLAC